MKVNKAVLCLALMCLGARAQEHISDPVEEVFTRIYEENFWGSPESVSGTGSTLRVTHRMRQELSALIKRFSITSIADAPCGDYNWMRYVDIGTCRYIGYDIVQELIEHNRSLFGGTRAFKHLNLIDNVIEQVDLIICRDMLVHLTYEQIFTALKNFKKSGSKYILLTTGVTKRPNFDLGSAGGWRKLDFEKAPFNFPRPLALIEEDLPVEDEPGKYLGLWLLDDIKI